MPKIERSSINLSNDEKKLLGAEDFGKAVLILSGNITELVAMSRWKFPKTIKKMSADNYMVLASGEIKEYEHSETRLDNIKGVRQSITQLRRIINTNIEHADECKWVTLTYAENMTDRERLMTDYHAFWKRFRRWCDRNNIPVPEYISVVEPQARGAWHCHLFMIWEQKAPFIPNDEIAKLWGHGFTKTKALNDVDNIGAYFSAYLADMPLDELEQMSGSSQQYLKGNCEIIEKDFADESNNIKRKAFVKGARLYLYPPGMNLYRCSRGIKKPTEMSLPYEGYLDIIETYSKKQKKASYGELTFSSSTIIRSDDDKVINHIDRLYFNTNAFLNGE